MLHKLAHDLPCGTTVYWNNMREEPLIYISGRPYVLRERANPFKNLEYTGAYCCLHALRCLERNLGQQ
jgi:hypothetical protein